MIGGRGGEREMVSNSMILQRSASYGESKSRTIRAAIVAVILTLSLGYVLMWMMMPTHIYREKWLPKFRRLSQSTYFGRQGLTILIYTFPVLLIAVLGSVYLHLGKAFGVDNFEREGKKRGLGFRNRRVIIRGLGIVSWIELAFLIMFIALLVWTFSSYLHFFFHNITRFPISRDKEWEARLERVALVLGIVGNVCLAFLFFPVSRGSSVLPIFGLSAEGSIKYHIWVGHITMFLFTAHGLLYLVYWAATHRLSEVITWDNTGVSNVAGELSLLFGLVLWVTTYPRIRQKVFEFFFYTHYFYILFMFFFVLHIGIRYACYTLPGFYLFLIDRYLRFLQSRQRVRLHSARLLPGETVELSISKSQSLSYTPTSIVFINVPSISKLQWHPFTISSSSNLEQDKLSVIIKREGSWTRTLYQMLSEPSLAHLDVTVEGPYGPVSTHFLRHEKLVMVSGGSGIAPFISVIRELIFMSTKLKCKTPQVLLISAFKNSSDLNMLDLLLPISDSPSEFPELALQIEAYVTREREPKTHNTIPKPVQTVCFKPNPSCAPMYPILGQNSWLWLGAVISSSFVIFLIFMGILTRYYIYPIDHNTDKIYSHSAKAVLNMLLICTSIAVTASAAFLWNKKQLASEEKLIHQFDHGADKELESLPHQSLMQAINVHYGERPDLKKILFECKGSSVGVLVCGPKKMRHEVAAICSSSLARNLYFEYISFNW